MKIPVFLSVSGSQLVSVLLPEDIGQYLETFLVVTTREGTVGISWVEAGNAAKHSTVPMTIPHNTELPSPNCP